MNIQGSPSPRPFIFFRSRLPGWQRGAQQGLRGLERGPAVRIQPSGGNLFVAESLFFKTLIFLGMFIPDRDRSDKSQTATTAMGNKSTCERTYVSGLRNKSQRGSQPDRLRANEGDLEVGNGLMGRRPRPLIQLARIN